MLKIDKQGYDEKLYKSYKENMENFPHKLKNFALKLGLKFNEKKYLNLKYKKSSYINKYSDLAYHFVFCYMLLCNEKVIDLPDRIKELNNSNEKYDSDIITLLCILQKMFDADGEKLHDKDLILAWGLLFDKEVYKETKRWPESMWKILKKRKKERIKPNDYEQFFKKKKDKYLDKNSFHIYKNKLKAEKLKIFLMTILDECDKYKASTGHMIKSQFYKQGFEIYVDNLELENLKKFEDIRYNYDTIIHLLNSNSNIQFDGKSKNSQVLNYIYTYYRDIFVKSFSK